MASRGTSPGGALLRASRVFSIPPPLPRPIGDLSAKAVFVSNTATLPHPIHQSITTPQASLATGDWGFKRPLPLRSTTKTSTPVIRVEAIDTFEHITEFNSSADHSISLRKWQEMGMPLSTPLPDKGSFRAGEMKSVFDSELDSISGLENDATGLEDTRWKFKGPWLAGQTEGDFNTFLTYEVRKRKMEFQKYLKTACAKRLTIEARQNAEGEMPAMVEESEITEAQFTEFVRGLRNTRAELYRHIRDFLDLPPAPVKQYSLAVDDLMQNYNQDKTKSDLALPVSNSPYADTGPPKTHPSAGLAYGLTSAHTYNHPVWGPQKHQPPILSRIIKPKNTATGTFGVALGVAGFVTNLPTSDSFTFGSSRYNKSKSRELSGQMYVDPTKVGGSKMWVHPTSARIDPKGRVILSVMTGDSQAVAVHEGTTDEIPLATTPRLGSRTFGSPPPTFDSLGANRDSGRGYGLYPSGSGSSRDTPRRDSPGRQNHPLARLSGL
ncbi:hypothetical protein WAI453_003378 [Rhynchosporium graminicola]|uniref:Mitochondrial ribosomal protein MRP51 n=1 Tax=Rhynchosporium graminicola TaxID=2792576 RepID=A0A1E1KSW4_9HELO|nr:uncharacterized protein RCO7_01766 [Rhynchosporium commune]